MYMIEEITSCGSLQMPLIQELNPICRSLSGKQEFLEGSGSFYRSLKFQESRSSISLIKTYRRLIIIIEVL